jgi:short-subunit dehydrogenase
MAKKKKLFVHGGSSLISKYLIKKFHLEFDEIHIFCRSKEKTKSILNINDFKRPDIFFYENDLENLDQTLNDIDKLPDDLSGVLWITGYTGDPDLEFENLTHARKNLNVNFVNVVLAVTKLTKKIIKNKSNFICVLSSVAGLRGRKKRLFYSAGKGGLINFLSGLRQKMGHQINIITVIPGYISTKSFKEKGSKFLITSPQKVSEIIFNSIKENKDIVYINTLWRVIMLVVLSIPEFIYKRLSF